MAGAPEPGTPVKVLILTNLFPSPWLPHRAPFNRQQFTRLAALHEVEVIAGVGFRDWLRGRRGEPALEGIKVDYVVSWYLPVLLRRLHPAFWLASLLLQRGLRLRTSSYDCILASWAHPDGVGAAWVSRWLGIPLVVKVHGNDINVAAADPARGRQVSKAFGQCRRVVAVSRALAAKCRALGAERVDVIYNGVDTSLFAPSPADGHGQGRDPQAPVILFVGNLLASKGCFDLLEAMPMLLERHPGARLVFAGSGTDRPRLGRRAASLAIATSVSFAGTIEHARLAPLMRAASVVCLPSHSEGVPNVLLEAMACGTPVVATSVGGIPEVVPPHAGILVAPRQPAALADALGETIARRWDRDAIAAHGAGFRWSTNVEQLSATLLSAVVEHASARATGRRA